MCLCGIKVTRTLAANCLNQKSQSKIDVNKKMNNSEHGIAKYLNSTLNKQNTTNTCALIDNPQQKKPKTWFHMNIQ